MQNRIGGGGALSETKAPAVSKVRDIRQLLEEKRQGHRAPARHTSPGKMGKTGPLCQSLKGELWCEMDLGYV